MKKALVISAVIYILGVIYLSLPTLTTPELSRSVKSNEPGDTWQHPEQRAFYTNLTRAQVISEMQSKYAIKIFGYSLPSYRLNYRPEESFQFVRDQVPSNYLEEIVYPFRESLFVNGWEPRNAPVNRNINPANLPGVLYEGQYYQSKVTLRPVTSSLPLRILIWTFVFPTALFISKSIKKSLTLND